MRPERIDLLAARPLLFGDAAGARRHPVAAVLALPDTAPPPWPPVVVSGAGPGVLEAATAAGFAAVAADPPRGWRAPTEATLLSHAFAALAALRGRDDIAVDAAIHLGFGRGGTAAVLSAYAQVAGLFAAGPERFAAHVAVGAPSTLRLEDYRTTGAPVALVGTAAEPVRGGLLAGDLREGGSAVREVAGAPAAPDGPPLRLTPENALLDERSGRPVRGPLGRLRFAVRPPAQTPATPDRLGAILAAALSDLPPRQEHP